MLLYTDEASLQKAMTKVEEMLEAEKAKAKA
jgi:hypothetical protein